MCKTSTSTKHRYETRLKQERECHFIFIIYFHFICFLSQFVFLSSDACEREPIRPYLFSSTLTFCLFCSDAHWNTIARGNKHVTNHHLKGVAGVTFSRERHKMGIFSVMFCCVFTLTLLCFSNLNNSFLLQVHMDTLHAKADDMMRGLTSSVEASRVLHHAQGQVIQVRCIILLVKMMNFTNKINKIKTRKKEHALYSHTNTSCISCVGLRALWRPRVCYTTQKGKSFR